MSTKMKTVGEILKGARLQQKISLSEISKHTKIHIKYLKAIEDNNFDSLPPSAFTKGFIKNYAKAISVNPDQVLAIFRRDYDQDDRGRIIPRGFTRPLASPRRHLNPKTTAYIISSLIGLIIVGFFIHQIISFHSAPSLIVHSPEDGIESLSPVEVKGATDPEATISVNSRPVSVSDVGAFTTSVNLNPGEHTIVIVSSTRSGKTTSVQRHVTVITSP